MNVLNNNSSFEHKTFIRDLAKVDFKIDEPFKSYSFSNFPNNNWEQTIDLSKTYAKRLVISPFLSEKIVSLLNDKSKDKLVLFSRKNELDKLPINLINKIEAYNFEQEIVNHHLYEKAEEGEQDEYNGGEWDNNLHAKIYIRQNGVKSFWDFGSANCSNAAFERNHEFLIHLESEDQNTGVNAIKKELLQEYNGVRVFKPYERKIDELEIETEVDFRIVEYELLKCLTDSDVFDAWIEPQGKLYDVIMRIDLPEIFKKDGYKISCNILGLKGSGQVVKNKQPLTFGAIQLHKLSSFIHWQITAPDKISTVDIVTKIEIRNMPEYRLSTILKSIIDRPEKFMALLMALLSDEPQIYSFLNDKEEDDAEDNGKIIKSSYSKSLQFDAPIYEELLINLSRNPERLMRLSEVIEKLDKLNEEKIIPLEFQQLWKTIKNVLLNE
jgi:hypothetical protein